MEAVARKKKLEALRVMRAALPPAPRAIVDLALVVVSLFADQEPVGVQLTWVREGGDIVSHLAKGMTVPEHLRAQDASSVGPVHEIAHLSLYLGRDCSTVVRVVPPVQEATWDLIVQVVAPVDGAVCRGPKYKDFSRRLVLRGVQRDCSFVVARCEFGCERVSKNQTEET
jgi:hypothetical protein